MDESHGVSTQSSTLCGRGRAGKLTWASQSVGKHGAAAPALVRARTLPSAARSATLLQARRLATPLLLERLDRFTIGLKSYSECIAAAVPFLVCSLDSDGPRSERGRKTDLTQNERKRHLCHLGLDLAYSELD